MDRNYKYIAEKAIKEHKIAEFISAQNLTSKVSKLYLFLLNFTDLYGCNKNIIKFPTQKEIASELNTFQSHISISMKKLRELELVNEYYIIDKRHPHVFAVDIDVAKYKLNS